MKLQFKKNCPLPNLYTAIKIYLTIPIGNCTDERVFFKFARAKNQNRIYSLQENLIDLIILWSKSDILNDIDINQIKLKSLLQ